MKGLWKYTKSFELGLQSALEYRANFLLSILSAIFPTVIQFFLWTAVFKNTHSATVYGYTYSQMITYALMAGIVSKLVSAGVEWEILNDIRDGGLSKFIVQPIGYFFYRICCFLGQKLLQLGITASILAGVLIFAGLKLGLLIEPFRIAEFIPAIILALVLNLFLAFIISLIAFWITEAWAAFMILNLLVNLASGGVFPVDIFGGQVLKILKFLPFQYIIFFPINVLNGKAGQEEIIWGMAIQGLWIAILFLLSRTLWNTGIKRYVAVGG